MLTEIYLCHACSCQEILRTDTAGQDPRGQLFWHMIRLVRANLHTPRLQPRAILLENVPGLRKNDVTAATMGTAAAAAAPAAPQIDDSSRSSHPHALGQAAADGSASHGGGRLGPVCLHSGLPTVLAALSGCGYQVSWREYDACSLVPQRRRRIYIVAVRQDLVAPDSRPPFVWPTLPSLRPTTGAILQREGDASLGGASLERYRLTPSQWARVARSVGRGSSSHRYHLPPPVISVGVDRNHDLTEICLAF
jgi:site-specific DNA-cytosine methylase